MESCVPKDVGHVSTKARCMKTSFAIGPYPELMGVERFTEREGAREETGLVCWETEMQAQPKKAQLFFPLRSWESGLLHGWPGLPVVEGKLASAMEETLWEYWEHSTLPSVCVPSLKAIVTMPPSPL